MAKKIVKAAATRAGATGAADSGGREDRSFGEVLRTKAPDRILPDLMNRVEGGRRDYVRASAVAIDAELGLLREERKRLEKESSDDPALLARLDGAIAAIAMDLQVQNDTANEFSRAVLHQPGGWTVLGRVLQRNAGAPKKATVEFASDKDETIKELGTIAVDTDGSVRKAYPRDVVAKIPSGTSGVHAVVRVGQRVVAADTARVDISPDALYQFDLRTDLTG